MKNIIGHSVYQLVVILTILFAGLSTVSTVAIDFLRLSSTS